MRRRTLVQFCGLIAHAAVIAGALTAGLSSRAGCLVTPASLALPAPEPRLISLLSTLAPSARMLSAVERDVDRDGDFLDVITATTAGVVLWVNDDRGHFIRKQPPAGAGLNTSPWLDDPSRQTSVQAAVSTTAGKSARADARTPSPPQRLLGTDPRAPRVAALRQVLDTRLGRAPPCPSVLA